MTAVKSDHRFGPRGACRAVMACRDPEVLISGPAGTGKSRACLEKLHMMALTNQGMRGLICRKTGTSLSSTALVTWRRFVANESLLAGDVMYYGGSAQEPAQYRYRNGSVIAIAGLDKISKIMSSEYDVIYVQEATELTENDWESLTSRLRNWIVSFQQLIADCNPAQPTHWLKQRCDGGRTTLFESRHEDNPVLYQRSGSITAKGKDYISKLDNLTGVRKSRLRFGRWVVAEGAIYEEYDATVHVIDQIPHGDTPVDHAGVPIYWKRYWAVDFGFVNPFVLQCWAEDPDGRLFLYREIYHTKRTVDQHAAAILSIVRPEARWLEPRPGVIVCDTDAEGRAQLETHLGQATTAAHKSVLEGIEAVQVRLRRQGDGRPRIYLLRNALVKIDPELADANKPLCTIDEIPGYVWKDTGPKREEPVKNDDHGCDAMRYVVADRDFGVRVIFRSFTSGPAW
jgi:phage terminase large subunit